MDDDLCAKACPICHHADQAYVIKGQGGNFTRFQCARCKDIVVSVNAAPRLADDPARAWAFAEKSSKLPINKLLVISVPNPQPNRQGSDDALCESEEPTINWACGKST